MSHRIGDPAASDSFSVARGASMLTVVTSHYFSPSVLWVASAVALFVFAFSSGAFTGYRHGTRVRLGSFWAAKFRRLGIRLAVIAAFLFALFLVIGESGVFTWQTVLAVTGMSGFLTWFGMPNPSPFGAGMWFLTLLLLYYAAYPVIGRLLDPARGRGAWVIAIGAGLLVLCLQYLLPMGHMLWYTAFGFVLGTLWGLNGYSAYVWKVGAWFVVAALLIVGGTLVDPPASTHLNALAVFCLCIVGAQAPLLVRLPPVVVSAGAWVSSISLEIYLVHTYLFVNGADFGPGAGYAASLVLILTVSWLLARISGWCQSALETRWSRVRAPAPP